MALVAETWISHWCRGICEATLADPERQALQALSLTTQSVSYLLSCAPGLGSFSGLLIYYIDPRKRVVSEFLMMSTDIVSDYSCVFMTNLLQYKSNISKIQKHTIEFAGVNIEAHEP